MLRDSQWHQVEDIIQENAIVELTASGNSKRRGDMKAGRELDALIAEKVMGCTVGTVKMSDGDFQKHCMCKDWSHCPFDINDEEQNFYNPLLKEYSTYIKAAWKVAEEVMKQLECGFNIVWNQTRPGVDDYWSAAFWDDDGKLDRNGHRLNYCANAKTAPLAICLVALKAVEGVEKKQAKTVFKFKCGHDDTYKGSCSVCQVFC